MSIFEGSLIALLGALGALGIAELCKHAWRYWQRCRLQKQIRLVFDGDSDQFRRTMPLRIMDAPVNRAFYVLGVINKSGRTIQGVHCFVTGIDELDPDVHRPTKQPLQPVGLFKGAEQIDVPPSLNGQPSVYFELAEELTHQSDREPNGMPPDLCVAFGRRRLSFITTVSVALEGPGFSHSARYTIATRKARKTSSDQPTFIPLTVRAC